MIELTEIMRQKDDKPFTELLNRIRTGTQTEADIQCIQSRSITHTDSNYPHDALHIWAENKPVDEYNATRLNQYQHNNVLSLQLTNIHNTSANKILIEFWQKAGLKQVD